MNLSRTASVVPLEVDRDFLARVELGRIWEVIPNLGECPFILQTFGDKALDIEALRSSQSTCVGESVNAC